MGCTCKKLSESKPKHRTHHRPSVFGMLSVSESSVHKDYKFVRSLGNGAFGQVRLVEDLSTHALRACKSVDLRNLLQNDLELLTNEVNVLKQLDHPHIIKIFEVYRDISHMHIITELCTGGDLLGRIVKQGRLTENIAAQYMSEIVSAVKYCHENSVVHRDLKPENIMFEDNSTDARLKIIDFGTSKIVRESEKMSTLQGTPCFIAPEVATGEYTEKCDVWSLGVILYIMLSGKPPFKGRSFAQILANIKQKKLAFKSKVWRKVSDSGKGLLKKLLKRDQNKRLSSSEFFFHPWLTTRAAFSVPDRELASKALTNLLNFHYASKLHLCAMSFIAHFYSTSDGLRGLSRVFEALDTDNDGKLSKEEIRAGLETHLGLAFDVEQVFSQCDMDGNGFIDFSEFLTAAMSNELDFSSRKLFKTFHAIDKDGNGKISKAELQAVVGEVGEADVAGIFSAIDINADGEISRTEFVEALKKGLLR
jgi:calcium-dependent protein kinase